MQKWEELAYAREEGLIAGEEKGKKQQLIRMVCRKLAKGNTAEAIADELEEEMEIIAEICNVAKDFAPDYDSNHIYEKLISESNSIISPET